MLKHLGLAGATLSHLLGGATTHSDGSSAFSLLPIGLDWFVLDPLACRTAWSGSFCIRSAAPARRPATTTARHPLSECLVRAASAQRDFPVFGRCAVGGVNPCAG